MSCYGSGTIVEYLDVSTNLVLRASGCELSSSSWKKLRVPLEAKPYGAQKKNMGKVVTCWLHLHTNHCAQSMTDTSWFCFLSFYHEPRQGVTILAVCELAPSMEEWLVEEAPPVTLRLYSNQEAPSLLSISHFLFLDSSLTLFLFPTEADRDWRCGIAQDSKMVSCFWMLALAYMHVCYVTSVVSDSLQPHGP